MVEEEKTVRALQECQEEHRDLDAQINRLMKKGSFDQILVQRLKKRKLWLRDRISFLQSMLYDDIIA